MPTKFERELIKTVATGNIYNTTSLVRKHFPGAIEKAKEQLKKERQARRFEGDCPLWVKNMTNRWSKQVVVAWRKSGTHNLSSGHCSSMGRIVVTAGRDERDQKVALAHELAHWTAYGWAHDDEFYDELYKIAKAEGVYRDIINGVRGGQKHGTKRAASRARKREAAKTVRRDENPSVPKSLQNLLTL